jgi:flagellar basal body P-ring formation protein FlgA
MPLLKLDNDKVGTDFANQRHPSFRFAQRHLLPQGEKVRLFCLRLVMTLSVLAFTAPAFADTPVNLRARIEASGPAVTLGDVFDGAGEAASRAVAPAPPAGQIAHLPTQMLEAAAAAAGLSWTAPAGLRSVAVVRPGGMRATLAPEQAGGARTLEGAAVRRGQSVTLVYSAQGLLLSVRARALEDGELGQSVQLVNLQSNRTVDAIVTGPNAASANAQ